MINSWYVHVKCFGEKRGVPAAQTLLGRWSHLIRKTHISHPLRKNWKMFSVCCRLVLWSDRQFLFRKVDSNQHLFKDAHLLFKETMKNPILHIWQRLGCDKTIRSAARLQTWRGSQGENVQNPNGNAWKAVFSKNGAKKNHRNWRKISERDHQKEHFTSIWQKCACSQSRCLDW